MRGPADADPAVYWPATSGTVRVNGELPAEDPIIQA